MNSNIVEQLHNDNPRMSYFMATSLYDLIKYKDAKKGRLLWAVSLIVNITVVIAIGCWLRGAPPNDINIGVYFLVPYSLIFVNVWHWVKYSVECDSLPNLDEKNLKLKKPQWRNVGEVVHTFSSREEMVEYFLTVHKDGIQVLSDSNKTQNVLRAHALVWGL